MAYIVVGCSLLIELFDIFMKGQLLLGNDSGANVMNPLCGNIVEAILLSNPEPHWLDIQAELESGSSRAVHVTEALACCGRRRVPQAYQLNPDPIGMSTSYRR